MDWHQQPGESDKAYRAFLIYRNLSEGRTLAGAWEALSGRRRGTVPGHVKRWSIKWDWVARGRAWDRQLQERSDNELADRLIGVRHRLADETDRLLDRLGDLETLDATLALQRLTAVAKTALGIPNADPHAVDPLTRDGLQVNLRAIEKGENADDGRDDRDGSDGDD